MLLYTSFPVDVFQVMAGVLKRLNPFNYYAGCTVACFSLEDQLLFTLMKLRLNCKDLDLAFRFDTSRGTVSNIINTYISVLHEILFEGILLKVGIPSQSNARHPCESHLKTLVLQELQRMLQKLCRMFLVT
ncbi:hypothetical protein DPMN_011082 [Dreissena polymorpha]|uniref:Transposase Helix-turn-helix domain-containing protein n=1 Tax=Dreissena polymorpha TaxID=45954 RepID=A0A9D4S1L0_DREPO|nr:hypothetical protein DPMN_011082 [Dreissena polymorpha]